MATAATAEAAAAEAADAPTALKFDMSIDEAAAFMQSFQLRDGSKPFASHASYLDRLAEPCVQTLIRHSKLDKKWTDITTPPTFAYSMFSEMTVVGLCKEQHTRLG